MRKAPLVSIIVNCFNGEKYLKECLESILSQTYTNYEVIFWDNLSNDNSKLIFLEIKDNRFKYMGDDEHVSLYSARNKAFKNAKGKYVAFLDVDDMWLPEKLIQQVQVMENNPNIGFCYSGFKFLNQTLNKLSSAYDNKSLKSGKITSSLLRKYNVGVLTLMVNKFIVESNAIKFDNRFTIMGDLDFVIRLSKVSLGVPIKSDLAIYRNHSKNLSLKTKLTVKERKLWQNEMLNNSFLNKIQLKPFIKETEYLNFCTNVEKVDLLNSFMLLTQLRGIFFFKGFYIFIRQFIFKRFFVIIKNKIRFLFEIFF